MDLQAYNTGHSNLQYTATVRKATVSHSGRDVTTRDVVFRDIKTTTVTQMRDVHIRDKIIKDCILLAVGMFSSRIVSCLHPVECGAMHVPNDIWISLIFFVS